MKDLT